MQTIQVENYSKQELEKLVERLVTSIFTVDSFNGKYSFDLKSNTNELKIDILFEQQVTRFRNIRDLERRLKLLKKLDIRELFSDICIRDYRNKYHYVIILPYNTEENFKNVFNDTKQITLLSGKTGTGKSTTLLNILNNKSKEDGTATMSVSKDTYEYKEVKHNQLYLKNNEIIFLNLGVNTLQDFKQFVENLLKQNEKVVLGFDEQVTELSLISNKDLHSLLKELMKNNSNLELIFTCFKEREDIYQSIVDLIDYGRLEGEHPKYVVNPMTSEKISLMDFEYISRYNIRMKKLDNGMLKRYLIFDKYFEHFKLKNNLCSLDFKEISNVDFEHIHLKPTNDSTLNKETYNLLDNLYSEVKAIKGNMSMLSDNEISLKNKELKDILKQLVDFNNSK